MMKLLSWIHRWVGAAVALLFGLIMLSGVILTLDHTAHQYSSPIMEYEYQPQSIEQIAQRVDYIHQEQGGADLLLMEMPTSTWPAYTTRVDQGRRGGPPMYYTADESAPVGIAYHSSQESHESNWTRIMGAVRALHFRLIWGSLALVAYIGIAGIVIALLGIIVWWPFRKAFIWRDTLWPRGVHYSRLLLNHMTGGLIAIAFLMLLTITGVYLGIRGDFMNVVRAIDGPEQTAAESYRPENPPQDAPMRPLSEMVYAAASQVPEHYQLTKIDKMVPEEGNHLVQFIFEAPLDLHPDGWTIVYMDPYSATPLHTFLSADKTALRHFAESSRPLHTGENMGLPYSIAICLGSIIVTITVFTGFVSFVKRQFWAKRGTDSSAVINANAEPGVS